VRVPYNSEFKGHATFFLNLSQPFLFPSTPAVPRQVNQGRPRPIGYIVYDYALLIAGHM